MSLHQQARKLIEQAETAIRANNPDYAIELLRQSILYNGKDADGYILLGISLAQTGMPSDAENAFKKATTLAPESVKARFNLAVHQYSQGQVRAALNNARKASSMNPDHAGAKDLVARLEGEMGLEPGQQPKTTAAGNLTPDVVDEERPPTASLVDRMGAAWTPIGWGIAVCSLAGLLLTLSLMQPYFGQQISPEQMVKLVSAKPLFALAQITFFGSTILGLAWTGLDAINRHGNLLWLLPQVACGCFGLGWIILPVYIITGRKTEETN
jgi:tetratricopeptide (TPR) repeat protein